MLQIFFLGAAICNPRVVTVFVFISTHRASPSHSIDFGQISMLCMSFQSDRVFVRFRNLRLKETPLQAPGEQRTNLH